MSPDVLNRRDTRTLLNAIKGAYGMSRKFTRGEDTARETETFLKMNYQQPKTLFQAKLRTEFVLINTQQDYEWNFKQYKTPQTSVPPDNSTEILLERNDGFHAYALRVLLGRRINASNGAMNVATYPDPVLFPAAAGFVPQHLQLVYNGLYYLKVDQTNWVDGAPTDVFRNVPQTLDGTTNANQFQELGFTDGMQMLEPFINIFGNKENAIRFKFPPFNGTALNWQSVVTGTDNIMIVELHGWLARGIATN